MVPAASGCRPPHHNCRWGRSMRRPRGNSVLRWCGVPQAKQRTSGLPDRFRHRSAPLPGSVLLEHPWSSLPSRVWIAVHTPGTPQIHRHIAPRIPCRTDPPLWSPAPWTAPERRPFPGSTADECPRHGPSPNGADPHL